MSTEVKICGLCRPSDARLAQESGADYLGVVLAPSPRRQEAEAALEIWEAAEGAEARRGRLTARRVGVFVDAAEDGAIDTAARLGLDVLQLHGAESPELCRRIGAAGDWRVWKAIHVDRGTDLVREVGRYAGAVDGVLIEGRSDRGEGGVGARFDWEIAASARQIWPEGLTLIMAGGLTAGNVSSAVQVVGPDVVDVSSGVERVLCEKDPEKLRAFIAAVKKTIGRASG